LGSQDRDGVVGHAVPLDVEVLRPRVEERKTSVVDRADRVVEERSEERLAERVRCDDVRDARSSRRRVRRRRNRAAVGAHGDVGAAGGGDGGDDDDGELDVDGVGEGPGEHGADGEAEISPEAVDAHGPSPPDGVGSWPPAERPMGSNVSIRSSTPSSNRAGPSAWCPTADRRLIGRGWWRGLAGRDRAGPGAPGPRAPDPPGNLLGLQRLSPASTPERATHPRLSFPCDQVVCR